MTSISRLNLVAAQYEILAERYQERAAFDSVWGMSFLDCLRRAEIAEEITATWTQQRTSTKKEKQVYAKTILGTDWPSYLKNTHDDSAELVERGWLLDTVDVLVERFHAWLLNETGKPHYDAMNHDDLQVLWLSLVVRRVIMFRLLERKMQMSERGESGFADQDTAYRMRQMMMLRNAIEQGARGAHHYGNGEREVADAVVAQFRDTCAELLAMASSISYQALPPLVQPLSLPERKIA
jgi:hypothetical protein